MLKSMSGRYGEKHVFRDFAGNTIVAKRPTLNGESSVGQEAHRGFFREAIKYATFTKDDPAKWAKYVSRHVPGRSAFNLAVSDFMCPPVIEQIDASQYMGHVSIIRGEEEGIEKGNWPVKLNAEWTDFEYSNDLKIVYNYVWMPVWSPYFNDVREKLGLSKNPIKPFHMTVGRTDWEITV